MTSQLEIVTSVMIFLTEVVNNFTTSINFFYDFKVIIFFFKDSKVVKKYYFTTLKL